LWFNDLGSELSRSFRALKVWFTLKEHGIIKLGEKIAVNCEQAQYLISLLEKHGDPIDAFNNKLVADMQLSGIRVLSTSFIQKKLYIRVAIFQ